MENAQTFEPLTHIKVSARTGKPLSKVSIKIYKSLLNRLAKAGVSTKKQLIEDAQYVIDLLDIIVDIEGEEGNAEKRKYYSAIFYALDEVSNDEKTLYHEAFLKAKVPGVRTLEEDS
jgi:hypothetical protein